MEKDQDQRRRELEEEIREIQRSWPVHTPSPAMFARLEELEEKLAALQQQEDQANLKTNGLS